MITSDRPCGSTAEGTEVEAEESEGAFLFLFVVWAGLVVKKEVEGMGAEGGAW
jgi:hypothetical protein